MKWRGGRRSRNVEDRRGRRSGGGGFGGLRLPRIGRRRRGGGGLGGIRLPGGRRGRRGGIGGILMVVAVLAVLYFLGVDPATLLRMLAGGGGPGGGLDGGLGLEGTQQGAPYQPTAEEQELADFVSVVLADTEDTWRTLLPETTGTSYQDPKLVLFSGAVSSACGRAQAAMGPFYCPADRKVYIDLSFYRDLRDRFRAPGDFAQAYVVAHEVAHHIQTLLGISQQVHQARGQLSQSDYNKLSVRLELQADCLAGVWAYHADKARGILEAGDVEEALGAAAAIGDDRIQRQAQGHVVPDSFTHGSSEQRVRWFRRGLENGDVGRCDTFSASAL